MKKFKSVLFSITFLCSLLILSSCNSVDKMEQETKQSVVEDDLSKDELLENELSEDVLSEVDTGGKSLVDGVESSNDLGIEENFLDQFSDEVLGHYFASFKKAGFVISDGMESKIFNEEVSNTRFNPFSTFKIPNSIVALETGVITKEDSLKKWDGTIYSREEINRDMDLQSAFEHSALWYYKLIAKAIGEDSMKEYLEQMSYGNKDISGGIDKFWLGSSLKISPVEQVAFLKAFYHNEFGYSEETINTVKSIMRYKGTDLDLYGKTGSSGEGLAWYVGYILVEEKPYYFAAFVEDQVMGADLRDGLILMFHELLD